MSVDNHNTDLNKISTASKLEDTPGIEEYKKQETEKIKNIVEYIKQINFLLATEGICKLILFVAALFFLYRSFDVQMNLILLMLGVVPLEIAGTPLKECFLESILTNDVDKKNFLMMFSTITVSFTVIFTTLIIGVFKSNKNYIQNLLKNILPQDD